ncbi:MAG: hypothetical protein NTW96_24860 [Planctomycetia bacterium]|nr:hypothetical protein [Planctomycetia bacterium]
MARFSFSKLTDAKDRFLQIADDYTYLNPHLKLTMDWFGKPASNAATWTATG